MITRGLWVDGYRRPVRALPAVGLDLTKKTLIALGISAALLGGRTLAADLPPPLLPAPVPKALPSLNWSGPYIGIGAGGHCDRHPPDRHTPAPTPRPRPDPGRIAS